MTDGTGTNSYTYNPILGTVTTGAGRLGSVSVPIAGARATVTYSYDELGRVNSRSIDGANPVGTTFDSLGRVTNVSNALGAFTYGYVDATSRLSEVTYPNGQKSDYSYF
jgi:YD repeat-containing protein